MKMINKFVQIVIKNVYNVNLMIFVMVKFVLIQINLCLIVFLVLMDSIGQLMMEFQYY